MTAACELAVAALADLGPLDEADLLEACGFWDDPEEDDDVEGFFVHLFEEHGVWQTGGPCFLAEHVLDGRVFTRRLSDVDVSSGQPAMMPDLVAGSLAGDYDHISGPQGWLDGLSAGDLVTVTWADGEAVATRVGELTAGPELQLLRDAFDDAREEGHPMELFELVVRAALADGQAFTEPRLPLGELVDAAGLELRDEFVAEIGFDWAALDARFAAKRIARHMGDHGLDRHRAALLDRLDRALDDAELEVRDALADPEVVEAFIDDNLTGGGVRYRLSKIEALVPRLLATIDAPAGAHLIAARVAEHRGDTSAFVAGVETALTLDPSASLACKDAAYLAFLRGDARVSTDLLRRSGASRDDPRFSVLRPFVAPPPGVSRNAPCPCGSGRKTKACCLDSLRHPLGDRAAWLFEKLVWFADRPPQRRALTDFVVDLLRLEDPDDPDVGLTRAHPEMPAFLLFDGDRLDMACDTIGSLLPEDERRLLEHWLGEHHRLVRIDDVLPGTGVRLTDVVTGERLQAGGRIDHHVWRTGGEAVALVLPVAGGWLVVGTPTVVDDELRDEVQEAFAVDALAVARVCAGWFAEFGRRIFGMLDARDRVAFAVPSVDPDVASDLSDEAIERLVIAEHPELRSALEADLDVPGPSGESMNPRLHVLLHVVVTKRLIADEPPETWDDALDLLEDGHDRHAIFHHLAHDVSEEVWSALQSSR